MFIHQAPTSYSRGFFSFALSPKNRVFESFPRNERIVDVEWEYFKRKQFVIGLLFIFFSISPVDE